MDGHEKGSRLGPPPYRPSAAEAAEELKLAIEHADGHNGKITVSRDCGALTLIQAIGGTDGNTTITETLDNTTKTNFTGGTDQTITIISTDGTSKT